jgi:L-ascorbate 6-phosphate lactonase
MTLAERIRDASVPEGKVAVFFLAQAGFVFKTPAGRTLAVDPYLTDSVQRTVGFKRMTPTVIEPEDLDVDLLIVTHEHGDHYDLDAVPAIAAHPRTITAGPPECAELWRSQGLPAERFVTVRRRQDCDLQDFRFRTVFADHGDLSPNCMGLLLDFGGLRAYITSDTAYNLREIPEVVEARPEVVIPVVNGRYGNLDAVEAAQLADALGARLTIPCHFWMFLEHGAGPVEFLMAQPLFAPNTRPYVMAPGEGILLPDASPVECESA